MLWFTLAISIKVVDFNLHDAFSSNINTIITNLQTKSVECMTHVALSAINFFSRLQRTNLHGKLIGVGLLFGIQRIYSSIVYCVVFLLNVETLLQFHNFNEIKFKILCTNRRQTHTSERAHNEYKLKTSSGKEEKKNESHREKTRVFPTNQRQWWFKSL